jgi:hypothetical protein
MLRLLLLLILIVLVARAFWRLIDGLIEGISGRPATTGTGGGSTQLVRDPVCGTWILPKDDMSLTEGRRQLFFCSAACRDHYRSRTA